MRPTKKALQVNTNTSHIVNKMPLPEINKKKTYYFKKIEITPSLLVILFDY